MNRIKNAGKNMSIMLTGVAIGAVLDITGSSVMLFDRSSGRLITRSIQVEAEWLLHERQS